MDMKHVQAFGSFISESAEEPTGEKKSIKDLDSRDERPMVNGIAELLLQVRDAENRREMAEEQIRKFKADGIVFEYDEFMQMCGLK